MQRVNEIIVSKKGCKVSVIIDGKEIDGKDIISLDIHVECGLVTVKTEKVNVMKLGDA